MDKYEYKVRSEEIKDLIGKKKYAEAMKIADTIDWRRVKNINMLCTVSDLYKLSRRYEESREILLLAYERHPGSRMIVYSLCELSIKLDDVVQAVEYYKEFVQVAPRDNGRYVLQYKLYEAQEVSLEERIAVLEELKRREYREKWAYELAYLYHRIGLSTKCVEECDELILWFGEGKYVTKAMELKMLHAPLSAEQQKKYKKSKGIAAPETTPKASDELDIEVKPVNVGEYATINLQKELAESMKEVLGEEASEPTIEYEAIGAGSSTDEIRTFAAEEETDELEAYEEELKSDDTGEVTVPKEVKSEEPEPPKQRKEYKKTKIEEIEEPGDFTQEILTNLLQDTGEMREIRLPEETPADMEFVKQEPLEEEVPDAEEVYFEDSDTAELPEMKQEELFKEEPEKPVKVKSKEPEQPKVVRLSHTGEIPKIVQSTPKIYMPSAESMAKEKNSNFDSLLSQEYDGQISLAVPEKETVEKQITGQMSIEDILLEWERMKKENEEKRAEAVRQRVKEQTGEIFSQFDASTKQGILAELDSLAEDSIQKEKASAGKQKENQPESDEAETKEQTSDAEKQAAEMEALTVEEERKSAEPEAQNDSEKEQTADSEEQSDGKRAQNERDESADENEQPEKENRADEEKQHRQDKHQRLMTNEEKKLFGSFIQTKSTRDQIINTIDNISLASYTGNVIMTGEAGMGSVNLAKNIIKEIQMTDSNFSGRLAKITGQALNHKDLEKTFEKLSNGALIVEGAGELKESTIKTMAKLLEQEKQGIIVILEDTKINMNKLLENHKILHRNFNLRIDVEAMDNDSLVMFAKKYALEKEYAIDELGVLALYTRISELQTSEHSVTTKEVKEIVDEAIHHADKKNVGHFMDILLGKRYDDEDMIILREKDFV
ncbi:MAG: hypothetical protein J6C33_05135 [Lachnospiraceae bacterium]|nr:hypothetical protein [Lachnospiraceae bacterium]